MGHGTRHDQGRRDFLATVDLVTQELPGTMVRSCFLEAAPPDIEKAVADMAAHECRHIVIVPLLLFAAGHAKQDIPAAARAAARAGLTIHIAPPLGCHPRILRLSARRFQTAANRLHAVSEELLLLFVGRGSRDEEAAAQLRDFVARRVELTPVAQHVTALLSMADPRVEAVLPEIVASPLRKVVVQPHLLYPGELLAKLTRIVKLQDQSNRRQQWILADCLGCDHAVADAISDRYRQTVTQSRVLSQ